MATTDYLAPVLQVVGIVGLPGIAYFVRAAIAAFERRTSIHLTDQQRAVVLGAATRGSGIVYDALASYVHGTVNRDPAQVREQAFKAGVDYLKTVAPEAIQALGINNGTLENMVRGELGKLLATDPSVTVRPVLAAPAYTPIAMQPLPPENKAS